MKKKLMCLALGVVAACSVAFSQVTVNQMVDGQNIVGTVNAPVSGGQILAVNTQITFVSSTGITYVYAVTTTPSTNPAGLLTTISNAIANAFNANPAAAGGPVRGSLVGGAAVNGFGSNATQYALNFVSSNERVPLDFGLSAVLGAGALAAVRARKRKKEELANA